MIRMSSKPPRTQRHFATIWGELDYLCKKIRYWLYTRREPNRARRYTARLEHVLRGLPENDTAILRQEGLALLCELKGKLGEAIAHRKREIQLMERLHGEAQSPQYTDRTRAYMLRDRDTDVLSERQAFLETLKKRKNAKAQLQTS